MADRNKFKRADNTDILNDDPFAELTRIMGFDPREPVNRAQSKIADETHAIAGEADLSIDLERELIGEFGAAEGGVVAYAVQADAVPFSAEAEHNSGATRRGEEPHTEDIEIDLDFDVELAQPERDAAEAAEKALSEELEAAFAGVSGLDVSAPSAGQALAGASDISYSTDRNDEPEATTEAAVAVELPLKGDALPTENHAAFADETDPAEGIHEEALDDRAFAEGVEASGDETGTDTAADAYDSDAPLIRLGAARDFADADAPVDMDFDAEPASEADEAASNSRATEYADDLEVELGALLGRSASGEAVSIAAEMVAEEPVEPSGYDGDGDGGSASDAYAESGLSQDDRPSGVPLDEEELEAGIEARPVQAGEPDNEATAEAMEFDSIRTVDDPIDEQAAVSEEGPVEEDEDPFAILASMLRGTQPTNLPDPIAEPASKSEADTARSNAPIASESPTVRTTERTTEYQYQHQSYGSRAPANVPDIETTEVPEAAVALADDLEIPEVAFEDDMPFAPDFDDFEAELASAFGQQAVGTPVPPASEPYRSAVREVPRENDEHEFATSVRPAAIGEQAGGAAMATLAIASAPVATHPAASDDRTAYRHQEFSSRDRLPGAYGAEDDEDLDYDPALREEMAISSYQEAEHRPSSRRGLVIAAVVGGLAVIGGVGAFAFSSGGASDAPSLVRADSDPVKVRPVNPGGTTVPNQDNKVFQTMNGTDKAASPTQEKLITGEEEPVDVAARAEPPASQTEASEDAMLAADDEAALADDPVAAEIAAAPKGEERVAPAGAEEAGSNDQLVAIAPRRVRTMVVRADGTLVPSEEPVLSGTAPASAAEAPAGTDAPALEPADPSQDLSDPAVTPEATASLKPADAVPTDSAPSMASAELAPDASQPAAVAVTAAPASQEEAANMPATGPVAPSRPADQPVDVVGEVKPQKVASAEAAAAIASTVGGWSVQIASQPSEAAAKSSYDDLARRYASVIGDRGVNIVKAEIAGKGTFWRVRLPAGSRNEAISLCESYKSAGGNCFVSK